MTNTRITRLVLDLMQDILANNNQQLPFEPILTTPLSETSLDSLGFAILVARLEEELGYDPFALMTEAIYPTTFGEFVEIYERFQNKSPG